MNRKLVTVRVVSEVIPIEGADRIELAKVDGWQCVVSKGEFKVGDLGVYFEIDSFLPVDPRFEFLRKSCYRKINETNEEGFRIKTMKLRGVLSQGLLIPISKLDEFSSIAIGTTIDYSDLLKVKKWDPPLSGYLTGKAKGNWPSFLCKTDEERIQNLSKYFNPEFFKGVSIPYEVSEKLDGCVKHNTKIKTKNGIKAIKNIKKGDEILTLNHNNNEQEFCKVTEVFVKENNDDWYEIITESNKKLIITGEHRVWLPKLQCYRKVKDLSSDDDVYIA